MCLECINLLFLEDKDIPEDLIKKFKDNNVFKNHDPFESFNFGRLFNDMVKDNKVNKFTKFLSETFDV